MPVRALPGAASVGRMQRVETPIGPLWLATANGGLGSIAFHGPAAATSDDALLREAEEQLGAYFAGELRRFDLPLSPRGTEFQRRVWDAVAAVPYGTTTTYSRLAAAIGSPRATRAARAYGNGGPCESA